MVLILIYKAGNILLVGMAVFYI